MHKKEKRNIFCGKKFRIATLTEQTYIKKYMKFHKVYRKFNVKILSFYSFYALRYSKCTE